MIRLQKGPLPEVLQSKGAEWTQEYLEAKGDPVKMTDTVKFRYRHPDVKAALRQESFNKCIYCESSVAFGETDHINPVSCCPEQIVEWANLGLVCKECNTHKSDYYAPAEPLVNPFKEEPSDHLILLGDIAIRVPGSTKGLRTISQLNLNRTDLLQWRFLRIKRLEPLMDQWSAHAEGETKKILRQAIEDEAADNAEYAATVRGYLSQVPGWNQSRR